MNWFLLQDYQPLSTEKPYANDYQVDPGVKVSYMAKLTKPLDSRKQFKSSYTLFPFHHRLSLPTLFSLSL